ncbi:MAG: hypothetical protein BWK76_15860 [Desulfobulbaceae bacterium A2]|nr:MAG: hypothetical protein BWK76_15860 [Desulfobulbaceae bacterium A2]
MPSHLELLQRLAVALAIGLLIGLERGWQTRGIEEGRRVAGLRTFGLIALFGGLAALLAERLGGIVLALGLAALAALLLVPYAQLSAAGEDRGATTEVAALLTFALGAGAALGHLAVCVSTAVVTALILDLKPQLHAWVASLSRDELLGTLKLLLVSVVLLPVLPDRGYGPWQVLNPRHIWLLVVLIAAIGFAGYCTMKIAGARLGAVFTGLLGGLISSTAVALNFSRLGRSNEGVHAQLAAGIMVAAATMFPRILGLVTMINPQLLPLLTPSFAAMTLAAAAATLWLWRRSRQQDQGQPTLRLPNPFELLPALKFTALLVVIFIASKAASEWFGDSGAYAMAVISGVADVDAISLSLAGMSQSNLALETATRGIVIACITNTISKGMLVWFIGGRTLGRPVALAFGFTILAGLTALLLTTLLVGTGQ